jgi:L-ascorbate metabolism protein UlaG (beta-lactamase superfamily)
MKPVMKSIKSSFLLMLALSINVSCTAGETGLAAENSSPGNNRIQPSKHGNKYQNWIPTKMLEGSMVSATWNWIKGGERTVPKQEIPIIPLNGQSMAEPSQEMTIYWLGHSTVIIELDGLRLMIDPVLSNYASPVPGFVKRFSKAPLAIEDLPQTDLVVISHDHYDHLDKKTIRKLAELGAHFFVPQGVGNHLKGWGIRDEQIQEATWWQEIRFRTLTITCTPARHYSGRGLFDTFETLWASWVIQGETGRLYYSGDTGYADHFEQIGQKFGPFDLTVIKIGAYDKDWPDIQIDPEQAVRAHLQLNGNLMLPVHWGTFDLALHPWDEPIIRVVKAAEVNHTRLITPKMGEPVKIKNPLPTEQWWDQLE